MGTPTFPQKNIRGKTFTDKCGGVFLGSTTLPMKSATHSKGTLDFLASVLWWRENTFYNHPHRKQRLLLQSALLFVDSLQCMRKALSSFYRNWSVLCWAGHDATCLQFQSLRGRVRRIRNLRPVWVIDQSVRPARTIRDLVSKMETKPPGQ